MFEYKKTFVSKEIIREFDKDGKVVRERTILNDGGVGQEEAEKRLKEAEEKMDRMNDRMKKGMDSIFSEMDKMFKELF